ncbi:hypothetical protein FHS55_002147 [Angulomicrobium tetraedrale]|uniref:Myb-like domain-containing protein n=1 Tax=Ancylobacter tetraedralis TaxID=217068 RepID=A0A839ZA05_9HYPH|nr:hypothetical protein [Ancylobacter tetraedralis]MBB3771548.1 hypothetical protein [Ancylobacter tetraedralis]
MSGPDRLRPAPRHKMSAPWSAAEDAILRDGLRRGRSFSAIAEELRWAGQRRTADSAHARAGRLGLLDERAEPDEILQVRDTRGEDPLLCALSAHHAGAPRDVRPGRADGAAFNWRRLVAGVGSSGSPAALCADEGDRKQW